MNWQDWNEIDQYNLDACVPEDREKVLVRTLSGNYFVAEYQGVQIYGRKKTHQFMETWEHYQTLQIDAWMRIVGP